ncbi:hypothetical protein GR184_01095 [Bacillus sp. BGMRC0062]|nr:hypothetical protein [Bacillus sp. BGMRC0062]
MTMPSSAHDPAGESREPDPNTTGGVPAAEGTGHHRDETTSAASDTEQTRAMPPVQGTDRTGEAHQTNGAAANGTAGAPSPAPAASAGAPAAGTATTATAGQPGAPAYTPPAALASMTSRHWWTPLVAGIAGYLGTVAGTVVALLLTLLGAAISDDSGTSLSEQLNDQVDDITGVQPDSSTWSWIVAAPFQLAAMAALVPLRLIISADGESGSAGITIPQYFALACGIAAAWFTARKLTSHLRVETRAVQWLMAALAGVSWGVVALIFTALTALQSDTSFFSTDLRVRITAMGGLLFPVLFVVGLLSVAAALSVRSTHTSPGRVVIGAERTAPGLLQVLRPMVVQFVVFGAISGLLLVIWAFVKGGAVAGFSALFWLPLAVGWLFVMGLLSALFVGGEAASLGDLTGRAQAAYLWTDGAVPAWAVVLVIVLAVLSVVCAALVWAHVRPVDQRVARNPVAWGVLPLAYFLLGLLLMWLLRVAGYAFEDVNSPASGAFSVRPAGWTCLVFLLWGVVIELLARFVAPAFMHSLPAPVTRWLRGSERSRGRAAVVASAAAMGGAAVAHHGVANAAAPQGAAASGTPAPAAPAPETAAAASSPQYPAEPAVTAQRDHTASVPGEQTQELPRYDDAAAAAYTRPPREPMDPAKKKRIRLIAIIVGAVLLLAVVAAVVFSVLGRTVFGPDKQAEQLLQSATNGKATAVTEAADPNVSTSERALLTDEVYGAAENRISSYEIKDTRIDGDHATVNATVTQDGVTTPVDVPMVSDSRNGLFKSWRVDEAAGVPLYQSFSVEVPAGVSELTVNGQKVAVDEQGEAHSTQFTVLPGDYAVAVSSTSKYVTYGGEQVAEIRAGSAPLSSGMAFQQSFTPALEQDVTKQLNAQLDKCAQTAEFEPEGCPFEYSIYGDKKDYRNPVWSIEKYPTYSVSRSPFDSGEISFTTTKSGEARLDYQHNEEYDDDEPADWSDEDTTTSISTSGTVVVSGDKLTVKTGD